MHLTSCTRIYHGLARMRSRHPGAVWRTGTRALSSQPPGGDSGDGEDEFSFDSDDSAMGASAAEELLAEEAADARAQLEKLADVGESVTPALAGEAISRVVAAAAEAVAGPTLGKADVLAAISPHTIEVLRACRMATNEVYFASSDFMPLMPIAKKVGVKMDIADLGLGRPAEEALRYLAGKRVKEGEVQFSVNRFPSRAENHYYALSLADRLVSAAKVAGGESVSGEPLETWEEIAQEVERQAGKEGGMVLNLLEGREGAQATIP